MLAAFALSNAHHFKEKQTEKRKMHLLANPEPQFTLEL